MSCSCFGMRRVLEARAPVVLAATILLFLAPPSASAQCDFDTSVWADGWVTQDYLHLQFAATGYDNSPYCGCLHVSYGSLTVAGEFADGSEFAGYYDAWHELDFSEGSYSFTAEITIYCWCAMGPVWADYAGGAVQAQSPQCADERDDIIQEYRNYPVTLVPSCNQFSQNRQSAHFQFSELNKGDYSWALIRAPLIVGASTGYGLDKWRENFGQPRIVNSAYRNPARNATVGGAPQSRHMHGDAVDLRNVTYTQQEWNDMVTAAQNALASWIEPINGPCGLGCTHADWRNATGGYQ